MNLRIVKRTIDKTIDYLIEYGLPSGYKAGLIWKPLAGFYTTLAEAETEVKRLLNPPDTPKFEVIWETRSSERIGRTVSVGR